MSILSITNSSLLRLSNSETKQISMFQSTYPASTLLRKTDHSDFFRSETRKEVRPRFIEKSIYYRNLSSAYRPDPTTKYSYLYEIAEEYDERINFLEEEGKLDGVSINAESMSGFLEFLLRCIPTKSGGLVLIDDGNLRAVWNSAGESFVGLQFLNHDLIEYVLFSQTDLTLPVSRSFGHANINVVMNQIKALKLDWLLYEQC